jgi:CDP-glycerol glycerophosphotransferase (TagB/SpsB family)
VTADGGQPHLLRRTLESARNQATPLLDVVVVCLDTESRQAADSVAGDDTRVRIFGAPDLLSGRRLGLRRARARHWVLAAPGDVYLPGALENAIPLLDDEQVVVLARPGEVPGRTNLEETPEVAGALRLGRLVLPGVDTVTLDDPDPDGMGSAARQLGGGFVLSQRPGYVDARLDGPPPHSPRVDPLPRLAARVAHDRAMLAVLRADAYPVAVSYAAAAAVTGLRPFLEHAEVADESTWNSLSRHAGELLDAAAEQAGEIDVLPRVVARLAAEGRRDDLLGLVRSRRFAGSDFPTRVSDGEVYADLGIALDPRILRLSESETALRSRARRLFVEGDRLVLEVLAGIRHVDQRELPGVSARLTRGDRTVALGVVAGAHRAVGEWLAESEHDHPVGLLELSCPLDALDEGAWQLELEWRTQGLVRRGPVEELDEQGSAGRGPVPLGGGRGVRLRRSGRGVLAEVGELQPAGTAADGVTAVEVSGHGLHVTVVGADAVWLTGTTRVDAVRQHGDVWAVPLAGDVWGLGERPLPAGSYELHVARGSLRTRAVLAPSVLDRVPMEVRTTHHRVRILRGPADGVVVRLDPLLADDEIGARSQYRLQQSYRAVEEPVDERLVYFQSFTGQWAVDHPLAIQQELVRRRPDLRVVWTVADAASTVPPGAEPVLHRGRAWYDALARAGHLVTNIELERWFRRRPRQQLLQTFHGYPSKAMGLGLWRSRGLLPSHIEQQLAHTSGTWNALLTPHPDMDRHYREQYAYDGRILALGYPRDDVLVSPAAKQIRSDTRHRLGVAPGQRAVLYAPTWRDDLATNFRAAEATHHLAVEEAAAALGDDFVLLLRGHRFHASTAPAGSRVLDVTSYPDVNDLILAADVAVLDYSSMRFDFALTGRPMIFLVPDLDDYGSRTRGFLWDFGETAPGPWVADTTGVVAQLRDLDGLASRWGPAIADFNARYNPLNDGHAAERVVTEFFADIPLPG